MSRRSKYKIDLRNLRQPHIIVVNDDADTTYLNQVDGCCCRHERVNGYLIPFSNDRLFDHLFSPSVHYLNFNFSVKKHLYKDVLEKDSPNNSININDVQFIDNKCYEAWINFTFTSISLFMQEQFNKEEVDNLDKQAFDIESEYMLSFLDKKTKTENEVSDFFMIKQNRLFDLYKDFKIKSKNYRYNGILTWQNSD